MSTDNELRAIRPYGTRTTSISYENAKGYCEWFRDASIEQSLLSLYRVNRRCFELVGFKDNDDGEYIGCDSEYVTPAVARRLVDEGLAHYME
jgi:hypothetical protein